MDIEIEESFSKKNRLIKLEEAVKKSSAFASNSAKKAVELFFKLEQTTKNQKKILFPTCLLLILSFIPWVSEAAVNNQVYSDLMKYTEPINPVLAGQLSESISPYTSGIEPKADSVALSMMIENGSYSLSQQLAVNEDSVITGPERNDATYELQDKETITEVAAKFDLHVATVLEANDINAVDANKVKPGTVLKIPSSDTSTSSDWLVAIKDAEEKQKEQALAEARKKQSALTVSKRQSSTSGYGGVDNGGLIVPISSKGISQYFGRGHTGIDYMANIGTPIRAAASGKVVIISTGWSGGYGNQILVDHGGGRASRYAHLSSIGVSVGEIVGQGQTIGYAGSTGRSTGPHLHFELIVSGRPVSPF